jgi:hypothetical protein
MKEQENNSLWQAKYDDFIGFGSRDLLIKGSATVASREEPDCLIFPD